MASSTRTANGPRTRLAVLGSPIAHSKSPALHAAAYQVLGLPWQYGRFEVSEDQLADFVSSRDNLWRGLSLTMPLKERVLALSDTVDDTATITGSANTLLFAHPEEAQPVGQFHRLQAFNTDVVGIVDALTGIGVTRIERAWILGAGATAHSALLAASRLGAVQVTVIARRPERASALIAMGEQLGVDLVVTDQVPDQQAAAEQLPDVVISTLPGGALLPWGFSRELTSRAALLDVAYDPWPTNLASQWFDAGGVVASGLDMLVHQALAQVRIFVHGDPAEELPDEALVLEAMRAAAAQELPEA